MTYIGTSQQLKSQKTGSSTVTQANRIFFRFVHKQVIKIGRAEK